MTGVAGVNNVGQIVGFYADTVGEHGFVAAKPSAPDSAAQPVLPALTPALANVVFGRGGSPALVNPPEPTFGADLAAPWADDGYSSELLDLSSTSPMRSEAAATVPSLATLRHVRDAAFAALDDPVADGLAGSLLPAGW